MDFFFLKRIICMDFKQPKYIFEIIPLRVDMIGNNAYLKWYNVKSFDKSMTR